MPATIRIDFDVHAEAISKALQAELAKVQGVVASVNSVIEQSHAASAKRKVATSIQEEQRGIVAIQALKQKAEQEIIQMREAFSAKVWGSEKKAATAIVGEIKTLQEKKDVLVRAAQLDGITKVEKAEIDAEKRKVDRAIATMRRIALENVQIAQRGAGAEVGIMGQQRNIEGLTKSANVAKAALAGMALVGGAGLLGMAKGTEEASKGMGQVVATAGALAAGVGGLGKAMLSAEQAQKLLNLAMAAAPWALAVTAIGLTVVALSGLLDSEDQATESLRKYTEEKKRHIRTTKELIEEFENEGAALDNVINYDRARYFELERQRDMATGAERARIQSDMDNLEKFIRFEDDFRDKRENKIKSFNKRNIDETEKKTKKETELQYDSHVLLMQALKRQAEEREALEKKYSDEQLQRIQERIAILLEVKRIEEEGEAEQMRRLSERIALQVEVNRIAKEGAEAEKQAAKEAADELVKQIQFYTQAAQGVFSLVGALKDLGKEEHKRDKEADARLEKQLAAHEAMSEANAGLAKDEKEAQKIRKKGEEQRAEMMRQRDAEEEAAAEKEEALARRQNTMNLLNAASSMAVAIANYAASTTATSGPLALALIPVGIGLLMSMFAAAKSGLGFKGGGYTGRGRDDEPAGIVHKNEFVLPAGSFAVGPDGKLQRIWIGGDVRGDGQGQRTWIGGDIGGGAGVQEDPQSIKGGIFISAIESKLDKLIGVMSQNKGRRSRLMLQRSLNRESI